MRAPAILPGEARGPILVSLRQKKIRNVRSGRVVVFKRWYVELSFGDAHKWLAVSAREARWILRMPTDLKSPPEWRARRRGGQ